ncbi:uncharacterized protein [Leptinotarsa decemlineata]|uniref:uncharacterized protein n=1 Tax=Leptinotarsa decemlineata TaxID=7539 RepID=UPI003D30AE0D
MSLEEEFIIEEVENFPCIWDLKHEDYKNKSVVENAWRTIAYTADSTVEECQDLWKSVRLKFVRERKIIKTLPSGSTGYGGSWAHFEKMAFLSPHVQTRRTKSNFLKRKLVPELEQPLKSETWNTMNVTLDDGVETHSFSDNQDMDPLVECTDSKLHLEYSVPSNTQNNILPEKLVPISNKKNQPEILNSFSLSRTGLFSQEQNGSKKRKNNESHYSEEENCVTQTSNEIPENLEDHYFGLSLASSLSKMKNNKKKLILKAEILMKIADAIEDN